VSDGILLTSNGSDPFISPLGSFTVRINFSQPVSAISFSSEGGGGGSGATPEEIASAVRTELNTELTRIMQLPRLTDIFNNPLASYNISGSFGKVVKDSQKYAKQAAILSA